MLVMEMKKGSDLGTPVARDSLIQSPKHMPVDLTIRL